MANRLKPLMPVIIHLLQTGFKVGRESRDNVLKMLSTIFWFFLDKFLQQTGLKNELSKKSCSFTIIQQLESELMDASQTRSPICNGTQQGCPLSPHIPVMEHLAIAIRNNPDIQCLRFLDHHYKLSMQAIFWSLSRTPISLSLQCYKNSTVSAA